MNIITLINTANIFNQFAQIKISSKLAYKIMKFCKSVATEEEFYKHFIRIFLSSGFYHSMAIQQCLRNSSSKASTNKNQVQSKGNLLENPFPQNVNNVFYESNNLNQSKI